MSSQYYATIKWEDDTPVSTQFEDIYYSKDGGLSETKYVFHQHNNLDERFSKLTDNEIFVIGETGFGSGLNFIATAMLWNATVTSNAKLCFISFEKHPLSPNDLDKILSKFPLLNSEELISQYNLPLLATHRIHFKDNICLNLVIGDIQDTIPKQSFLANAWFLDGFTPTKNSDMWNDKVINYIALNSHKRATFATFTASGIVRRSLENAGFIVNKVPGFTKREMLCGYYSGKLDTPYRKPWYARYSSINKHKKVIIIGGGISGATTAYSLARRGYQVTLYEKNPALALEASGNYQAILYGHFAGNYNPSLELSLSGYRYSHSLITHLLKDNYQESGIIELIADNYKLRQILRNNCPNDFCYPVDSTQIEQLAGVKINSELGIYYPSGIWLNPTALINELVHHPNITIILNTEVTSINCTNGWEIKTTTGISDHSNHLILCNSHNLNQFIPSKNLPLIKTSGQISIIKGNLGLKTIICGNGYITPNRGEKYTIGATFKNNISNTAVNNTEHAENIAQITNFLNIDSINPNDLDGQANIRASTIDHLPLVGPIADYTQFTQTYAQLSKDAKYKLPDICPYLPGLYINAGFGSKGLLFAPVCGEVIADYIDGTPFAVSENLRHAIHPHRFWIKDIIQGKSLI